MTVAQAQYTTPNRPLDKSIGPVKQIFFTGVYPFKWNTVFFAITLNLKWEF